MKKYCQDLTGKEFGYLTVIHRAENYITPSGQKHSQWLCKCRCGQEIIVKAMRLKNGETKSCGCLRKEVNARRLKKYNAYDLSGEYGVGYTFNGETFYFDLDDYDKIKEYCWHLNGRADCTTGTKYVSSFDKNGKVLFMHRLVMGVHNCKSCIQIDHFNHNKQDNRKSNLRYVTNSENQLNVHRPYKNNTSGHIGVNYDKSRHMWYARIQIDGKDKYLGSSKYKEDAIRMRKEAEKLYDIQKFIG